MNKHLFKIVGKVAMYVAGVLLLVFLLVAGFGAAQPSIKNYLEEKRIQKTYDDLVAQQKAEEKALQADTYGGGTPEETLDMIIAALEAGDVELASKYEMPTKQKEMLVELRKQLKEDGNLDYTLNYVNEVKENAIKKCGEDSYVTGWDWCVFEYTKVYKEEQQFETPEGNILIVPIGGSLDNSISFGLNPFTNVWKVTR